MINHKETLLLLLILLVQACQTTDVADSSKVLPQQVYTPDEDLGELFVAVQTKPVFEDSKTFVDCSPAIPIAKLKALYEEEKANKGFDLNAFVEKHFHLPEEKDLPPVNATAVAMEEHLMKHWDYLKRSPDTLQGISSLLPLPHPYIVPGGRFREIYYWDSYFTLLGLAGSDRLDLVKNMLDNFAYLIDTYGFIPNGNRSYYLSRSQPPFFAAMVMLYAEHAGMDSAAAYLPQLEKEYAFWMQGSDQLQTAGQAEKRVVMPIEGVVLNRYWDNKNTPRAESYLEDYKLAQSLPQDDRQALYRNIRAAAESGWDFSSRWFADGKNLATIQTTSIIPVDLNSLMYYMENTLAQLHGHKNNVAEEQAYKQRADARKKAIQQLCWNNQQGYYFDYNFIDQKQSTALTLAGAFPLYFRIAEPAQAVAAAKRIQADFLKGGGLVTTLTQTGQQWDFPNGWAPLQWIAIEGLRRYNQDELANNISGKWLQLNRDVFNRTGKMMEKYNVVDLSLKAGGGEYPNQDGFGWTNGVAIAISQKLPKSQKVLTK